MKKEITTPKKTLNELAEDYEENIRILDRQIQRKKDLIKKHGPQSAVSAQLSRDITILQEMRMEQNILAKQLKTYYEK